MDYFNCLKYSHQKQEKAQFCFQKKGKTGEIKICVYTADEAPF
jgi:hypothetical protein